MSNALAIAAVTAVLRDLLNNAVIDHGISTTVGNPVTVTALPPDRIKLGDDEQPQLNLFLYRVAPNTGWSNAALPSRDSNGSRITNPPLALDLYYLLSAYGKNDFDGEILLGYGMQRFHETPVLPRSAIRTALGGAPPVSGVILPIGPLAAADLADQVEQIKIALYGMNTEEISKLWSALQARYRPTAAYHVSVVLIEESKPVKSSLPVTRRNICVQPFQHPFIEEIAPRTILAGQSVTLRGRGLQASETKVNFGRPRPETPTSITDSEVVVTPPTGLFAGINSVQVVQLLSLGTPADPHFGFESNVAPFVLAPRITTPQPISVQRGNTLTLAIEPSIGPSQQASLLVGDRSITIPARPAATAPAPSVGFPIPKDFPTGTFPMRVQIDGAQSPLEIDENPVSPTFGQLTGNPKVTVTA